MSKFDDILNKISDTNWTWWPVLSLRPARHETMGDRRILSASPFAGTLIGLTPVLTHAIITGGWISPELMISSVLAGIGLFFFSFKFSFARSWNRRAMHINEVAGRGLICIAKFKTGGGRGPRDTPLPFPARRPSGKSAV